MQGWVIVYVPGGNVYQMLDVATTKTSSFKGRLFKGGINALLGAVQLYYWLRT